MLKRVKRKTENSRSWGCFTNRTRYISNQGHPHHRIKKVVLAAVNFGCMWGQAAKNFIGAVRETQKIWQTRRKKKKSGGNPTKDIFFELVYSAPEGIRTTVEERDAIDKMITEPFRNCPIRRAWHLAAWDLDEPKKTKKWKPLDDVHYLIAARDHFGKATISERFGHGQEMLESWMRRMDDQICDMLNQTREQQYESVRTVYRRRLGKKLGVKLTKLHEMIAHHTSEPVTRNNLVCVIEEMIRPARKNPAEGLPVATVTNADRSLRDEDLVRVLFTGRQKAQKYKIEKLLLNIAETQLDIEQSKNYDTTKNSKDDKSDKDSSPKPLRNNDTQNQAAIDAVLRKKIRERRKQQDKEQHMKM